MFVPAFDRIVTPVNTTHYDIEFWILRHTPAILFWVRHEIKLSMRQVS